MLELSDVSPELRNRLIKTSTSHREGIVECLLPAGGQFLGSAKNSAIFLIIILKKIKINYNIFQLFHKKGDL